MRPCASGQDGGSPALNPMDQRDLIAPFREPHHNPAMYTRLHERPHGRLVEPYSAGPEGAVGVSKDRNSKVPGRALGLERRTKRLDQKDRHVAPRPNPKPCDGHEGHELK